MAERAAFLAAVEAIASGRMAARALRPIAAISWAVSAADPSCSLSMLILHLARRHG